MKKRIYTTGFHGKNIADLPFLLDKLDAVTADIRFLRVSDSLEWRSDYLNLLLKNRYRHLAAFGNRAEGSGKIAIHNFEMGWRIINSWSENVLLLCECESPAGCHRTFLAGELRDRGLDVEEISRW